MKHHVTTLACAALLASCATQVGSRPAEAPRPADAEANRSLVLAFHAAIERQDFEAAGRMLAPGYRHYVVSAEGFRALGWDDFQRGNAAARAAFPDWRNVPIRVVAEGDYVSMLLLGSGTHRASLGGEPVSGRKVTLPIALTHEVRNGKLVADWEVTDTGPLMRSLAAPAARATPVSPAAPATPATTTR
jgi:predicted ester cyclase